MPLGLARLYMFVASWSSEHSATEFRLETVDHDGPRFAFGKVSTLIEFHRGSLGTVLVEWGSDQHLSPSAHEGRVPFRSGYASISA